MRDTRRTAAMILLVLCSSLALTAYGRVFFRWRTASHCARALRDAGGRLAYSTPIILNGGKGELDVFSFDTPIAELVKSLARLFGVPGLRYEGGNMATGFVKYDGRVIRLTVVRFSRGGQTLVFALSQQSADYEASRTLARGDVPPDAPFFPGARPLFYAQDEKADMLFLVATTRANPIAVQGALRMQLLNDGWEPFFLKQDHGQNDGQVGKAHDLSIQFYLKAGRLCCVHAGPALERDATRITVLQKKQQIP